MDRKYVVICNSDDAELVNKKIVSSDEAVYVIIVSTVLPYFEEDNTFPKSERRQIKQLLFAIKSGKWENVLEPANKFLYEMGNGEGFEVTDYAPEIEDEDYSEQFQELMERAESIKLSEIIEDDDE